MTKVFLSYAQQDRAFVDEIEPLLREQGVLADDEEIIDPRQDLEPGIGMRETIRRQVMAAGKVLIINTPASATSPWVNYEAGMASALDKPIIVVHAPGSENSTLAASLGDVQSIAFDTLATSAASAS